MSISIRNRPMRRAACEPLEPRLLLSAGDLDTSFGGGIATAAFPGVAFTIADTAIAPDGKVVVAGKKGGNMAVARFNVNGTIDTTFGTSGLFESTRRGQVTAVAVQGDGKIVVSFGAVYNTTLFDFPDLQVGRLLANGSDFDSSFGSQGIATVGDRWDSSSVDDVAVQRDGKILAAGWTGDGSLFRDEDFAIVRYNADGSLDLSFGGGDGISEHGFGGVDRAKALTIDYNGNAVTNPLYGTIVVVGHNAFNPSRFTLLRLRPDGTPDPGFSGDGLLISPDLSSAGLEIATGVVVQPGGKIVVSGTAAAVSDDNLRNFLVARYLPNGALDTTFNGTGFRELSLGGKDEAGAVAIGYLGTLLVSGSRNGQFAVVAFKDNGTLDTRFSGDGILTTSIPGYATGLAVTGSQIAPIRRLVIAGGNAYVLRVVDVGSVVSIGSFDPNAAEAGQDPASFIVARTERLPFAERIFLTVGGTATPPGLGPFQPRDYNGTNIVFGNNVTTATYVDIPANETFVVVTITPVDDAIAEPDETAIFRITPNVVYDVGFPPSVTLIIRDNDTVGGPTVISSQFMYQDAPRRLQFTFSQDVASSIGANDFQLTGPAGMPAHAFSYEQLTNTVTLSFNGILPDGNYTARAVASGIANSSGQVMTADHVLNFFFLNGDANRDRVVNIADLGILAANWQGTGKMFSEGDFNLDGVVNIADLGILAANWQKSVPAPLSESDVLVVSEVMPAPAQRQPVIPAARRSHAPHPYDRSDRDLFANNPLPGDSMGWDYEGDEDLLPGRSRKQ